MCKTARIILDRAKDKLKLGDEEMACLEFMNYFNLVDMIRKVATYGQRQYIARELGTDSEIAKQRVEFEQLKKRLEER